MKGYKNEKPNIILIVIDSLRADHVGPESGGVSLTPILDRFAENCVVFSQAITQGSTTPPATKALLSSTYPYEYDGAVSYLSSERPMLPSHLQGAGYETAGINPNLFLSSARGWNRGFNFYDDCDRRQVYKNKIIFRGVNQITRLLGYPLEWPITLPAEMVFKRAISWIKRASTPFFLWIQTMDVHWPYRIQYFSLDPRWQLNQRHDRVVRERLVSAKPNFTPAEHEHLKEQYQNSIRYMDNQLGSFLSDLKERGLLENTLIIITADHGEEFGEHGGYFHSSRLYDVLLRVPMIFYMPSYLDPVNRCYSPQVRLIDIVPTVLDLAKIPLPDYLRGVSLLPISRGGSDNVERPAFTEAPSKQDYSLRWQGWKYLHNIQTGVSELYHLETDPDEKISCLYDYPEMAEIMRARLDTHINTTAQTRVSAVVKSFEDPEAVERLRNLGYVE